MEKVSLHAEMFELTYLATALTYLQAGDYAKMRQMKIKMPKPRHPVSATPKAEDLDESPAPCRPTAVQRALPLAT